MTRAKKRLFLTSAEDYGGKRKKKPSIFVQEIRDKVKNIHLQDVKSKQKSFDLKIPEKRELQGRVTFKLPTKFSYTQLIVFENCPKQYKYRHLLRIQGKGSVAMSFGNSMHNTLARFYKEILEAKSREELQVGSRQSHGASISSLDRLLEIYDEEWIPDYYDSKKHEETKKNEGREQLKDYFEKNRKDFDKILMIEEGFNVKIGDYTFKGVVDRVDDLGDGKVAIIDYKTGREKKEREVKKDKQLTLYSFAMKQVFDKKAEKVSLYFLTTNNNIESERSEEEQDDFIKEVTLTVGEIKKSDFKAKPGFHCQFCDYQGICEDREK